MDSPRIKLSTYYIIICCSATLSRWIVSHQQGSKFSETVLFFFFFPKYLLTTLLGTMLSTFYKFNYFIKNRIHRVHLSDIQCLTYYCIVTMSNCSLAVCTSALIMGVSCYGVRIC